METPKEKSVQEMYVVSYYDIYGDGNDQKLEVILESRNHFSEWLKQHNDNLKMDYISDEDFIEHTEEEFDLIPLNIYLSKS